ncbi:MAG: hypothetical protein R2749_07510 [Acidimicrobiales bacterium]
MIDSVACSAPARPPLTGASSRSMPRSANRAACSAERVGTLVLVSTTMVPGRAPAATPSSSNSTASTTSTPGRLNTTTSAAAAADAGVGATTAPSAASSAVRAASTSNTVTDGATRSRLRAIGAPMMPVPMTATRCCISRWAARRS